MTSDRREVLRQRIQRATPIRAFFGFDLLDEIIECKRRGEPFLYCDHAYFNRGYENETFRATINGIHQVAVKDCPHDRLEKFGVRLRPWKEPGLHTRVIVIPAVKNPTRFHGGENWNDSVPALVCREPDVMFKPKKDGLLPDLLKRAKCLLAHVSVAAVEAVCHGVPVVVDRQSPAWPVSSPSLDDLRMPEREQWAASLTYSQFTLSELTDGSAWKMLNEYHSRGTEDGTAGLPAPHSSAHGQL